MKLNLVVIWLKVGIIMIMIMIALGGITRLTGSGLSITEWNIFKGAIPPTNQLDWEELYNKYKQTPEFILKNHEMKLDKFKSIFFWEFTHRLWGRIMGFVFIIPFFYFFLKKHFKSNKLAPKMIMVLILGGLQGALGWFMVKSGLVDQAHVSHYRLTAHLLLALVLLMYLVWLLHEIKKIDNEFLKQEKHPLRILLRGLLILLLIQLIYGGFMSGKKAALYYPTYPSMNGHLFPPDLLPINGIESFTENVTVIHFIHRLLPWLIILYYGYFLLKLKSFPFDFNKLKAINYFIIGLLVLQISLGIKTVLLVNGEISVFWGTMHQLVGVVLFISMWWLYLSISSAAERIDNK